tara:strand:+ start:324 stop:527 length:204 start_codon:yes stop_codon:yes gene_type:complete
MTSEATALQMALPLFNTKITSQRCKHCNGSGYKKSKFDGYMHVYSYCSGTGRKLVLTRKYDIEKGPA